MRTRSFLLAGASLYIAACVATAAQAQAPEQPAQATADQNDSEFGDIVVTAQKREQTLQEVPVSVAVIGDELLREQRVTGVNGLGSAVPNLTVSASPFQPYVAIRGLGSGAGSRALEQSVATYVDGVYAGRPNQFLNPFFDVQRVEVVRGPQGVLFGVNSNAGGINIVNKKADGPLEGYVTAGYEFANQGYNFEGAVTVPLSDTLGIRVGGKYTRDGAYLHDLINDRDVMQRDYTIGRAMLSWRPADGLSVDLSYDYSKNDQNGRGFQSAHIVPGVFAPIEDGKVDFNLTIPAGRADYTRITSQNVILNASYELGDHILSSSSGYSTFDFSQGGTPPGTVFIGTVYGDEHFKQFYQEVRLASPKDKPFEYIIGATYLWQDDTLPQGLDVDLSFFGAKGLTSAIRSNFRLKNNTLAAFGQGTFHITPELSLTGGVRYSTVKKDVDYLLSAASFGDPLTGFTFNPMSAVLNRNFGWMLYVNPAVPSTVRPTTIQRSRRFNAWNPSVSLNWEVNKRFSTYASVTTGTKAGGFNDQEKTGLVPENGSPTDPFAFDSEKAINFEAGVKYLGHSVRFTAAAFYAKYKDMQVSQAIANGVVTSNAGSSHATGFEAEGEALLAPGLTVGADFAYIDGKYDDFPGVGCIPSLTPTNCNPLTSNAKGGKLTGLAKVTGSLRAAYETAIGSALNVRLFSRVHYDDGAQWTPVQDPKTRTPSYTTLDAGVTFSQDKHKGWSLTLTGKNLTNEIVQGYLLPNIVPAVGYQVIVSPGRQVFLDLRYDF